MLYCVAWSRAEPGPPIKMNNSQKWIWNVRIFRLCKVSMLRDRYRQTPVNLKSAWQWSIEGSRVWSRSNLFFLYNSVIVYLLSDNNRRSLHTIPDPPIRYSTNPVIAKQTHSTSYNLSFLSTISLQSPPPFSNKYVKTNPSYLNWHYRWASSFTIPLPFLISSFQVP